MIAVTHPGKMGDALYTIPVIKTLCKKYKTEAVFYTSSYCKPLETLFRFQPFIKDFVVSKKYHIARMDMGVQPWFVPVDGVYENVFHLGFREVPDTRLDHYMARLAQLDEIEPIEFLCPPMICDFDYYVLAPRGETAYKYLFLDFISKSDLPVIVIGGKGDYIGKGIDATDVDFLDTATIISGAKGFVGLMSSQLVLANGFNIPKIAVHDGKSWDMRHVVYSDYNFYPIDPTEDELLEILTTFRKRGIDNV